MIDDCLAVIMAGGDSRRMGRDKVSLALGEQSLLQRVAEAMQTIFPQVVASVRQPRDDIVLPQVRDVGTDAGPLAGLCAALQYAEGEGWPWLFAIATDMPFVRPALVNFLAGRRAEGHAVVPMVDGHPQPLAAFYPVTCLPTVRTLLEGVGKRSLRAALERIDVCYVDERDLRVADAGLDSFFDLDTPEDATTAAEHLLSR
ncbi:MAG: molybdenum cofactor guanylyltransferase [Propionivibrio sp.]